MFIKRFVFLALVACTFFSTAYSQNDDFCKAVMAIVNDAPNSFRNIKGAPLKGSGMWECGIKVPGTIASRFVYAMGLYYEGAFFQTKNKEDLKGAYEKYKEILSACVSAKGYTMTAVDNFYPGLGNYKKLIFMREEKEDEVIAKPKTKSASKPKQPLPPAHFAMEVDYSKEVGKYTIVMFIFEH
jgi:hypothetical protein